MTSPRQAKMTESEQRAADLKASSTAIDKAIFELEKANPPDKRDEYRSTKGGQALVAIFEHDLAGLMRAKSIVEVLRMDPDGFSTLMRLRHEKRWAFDSCVELARQELARPDAPAEEKAA